MRVFLALLSFFLILPPFSYADSYKTAGSVQANRYSYQANGIARVILRPTRTLVPFGEGIPTFYCAPLLVCSISLLPGDTPESVLIGDKLDWSASWSRGTKGGQFFYRFAFKPNAQDITTNIIIQTTGERSYVFNVKSVEPDKLRVPLYAFYNPGNWNTPLNFPIVPSPAEIAQAKSSTVEALKEQNAELKKKLHTHGLAVNPLNLEYRYKIIGNAPWKPSAVYDDKTRVFIQFPPSADSHFHPVFYLQNRSGQLLTDSFTRVSDNLIIVPHLFRRGALVYGNPKQHQRIIKLRRISAEDAKQHKPWYSIF